MKMNRLVLSGCLLMLLSGCSSVDNSGYKPESTDGKERAERAPVQISNDWDNYMEQPSDQILNTPYSNSNVDPPNGAEADNIRHAIKSRTDYKAESVWIDGETVNVRIVPQRGKGKPKNWAHEERRIIQILENAEPRYRYVIKLDR